MMGEEMFEPWRRGGGRGTRRDSGKGKTEELWGRGAVIRRAPNSKGHKMGGRWPSLSCRVKSQEQCQSKVSCKQAAESVEVEEASISTSTEVVDIEW